MSERFLVKYLQLSNKFVALLKRSFASGFGHSSQVLQVERVWSLDRQTESAAPHLSRHASEGTSHSEHDRVVVVLGQTVMHQKCTRTAVYVWPRILDLASRCKQVGNRFEVGPDQLDQVVILDVIVSIVELGNESRVSLAQDAVAIPRNHLAGLHGVLNELLDVFASPTLSILLLERKQVVETFLIGKTVQGTSQSVHTGREGQVRVRKCGTN